MWAQFHRIARDMTLAGSPNALDAVNSVAAVLTIGCSYRVQDYISVLSAPQGIRLNPPNRALILQIPAQTVDTRASIPQGLELAMFWALSIHD